MIKCAFYGSLRKPDYNYRKIIRTFGYGPKLCLYLKTQRIKGFEMYNLGMFPAIKHSDENHSIVVDIFDICDNAYDYIYSMETGAGYYEDEIFIDDFLCKIFVFKRGPLNEDLLITTGDWIAHKNLNPDERIFEYCSS